MIGRPELHAAGLGECEPRHRAPAAPAGIRGEHHRVYFNGTQVISHDATGYPAGQPGIAASVFGGPQVKILSFEGGGLD